MRNVADALREALWKSLGQRPSWIAEWFGVDYVSWIDYGGPPDGLLIWGRVDRDIIDACRGVFVDSVFGSGFRL